MPPRGRLTGFVAWATFSSMKAVIDLCLVSALLPAAASPAAAAPQAAPPAAEQDKSRYHLFDPTPPALMRPMSPDRPDFTESPYTVDAGHIQVEMSFLEFSRNGDFESLAIAPINLKIGLLNNADLQFIFTPRVEQELPDGSQAEGFDDIQFRLKMNVWGNDGGDTALGLMPFVKLPVGDEDLTNDHVEGGIIVPMAIQLPEDFSLGVMAEVDWVYDSEDDSYDMELVHTAALGHGIVGDLGGYVEYIGILTTDADNDYRALLGTGLTFQLSANMILDFGINLGLTGDADDLTIFGGATVRF